MVCLGSLLSTGRISKTEQSASHLGLLPGWRGQVMPAMFPLVEGYRDRRPSRGVWASSLNRHQEEDGR
jgi:hypothetical protein